VALLDDAVLYRDAFVQHAREPVDHAALDVAPRHFRLHHQSAVDREPNLVHADLAAIALERDLRDAGAERTRTFADGKAERAPGRPRRLPVAHPRDLLEARARPR